VTFAQKALSFVGFRPAGKLPAPSGRVRTPRRLDRMAQLLVQRPGQPQLFTQELGLGTMLFECTTPLQPGDTVPLSFLVRAGVMLSFQGEVRWVQDGGRSGQIDFELDPVQEGHLQEYLDNRSR
jgi:hypothetical protein